MGDAAPAAGASPPNAARRAATNAPAAPAKILLPACRREICATVASCDKPLKRGKYSSSLGSGQAQFAAFDACEIMAARKTIIKWRATSQTCPPQAGRTYAL